MKCWHVTVCMKPCMLVCLSRQAVHACPPVIVPPDKFRPTYSNFTLGSDPTWFILRLRSGAALWCGAGAALSPIPLVLGFLEPILKGWSKPVSTPPRPLQSFRHICPGSFSFMLLAASLLSACPVVP
jgi:hypothetical protein